MIIRIKQFLSALYPLVSSDDYKYVQTLLNAHEEALFMAMDNTDRKHCLDVARTCAVLAQQQSDLLDHVLLLKGALLHDVGKRKGDLTLWNRVAIVLLQTFSPRLFHRLAEKQNTPWYIAKHHPAIGAVLCLRAGCSQELINLVKQHHAGGSNPELRLLMKADAQH